MNTSFFKIYIVFIILTIVGIFITPKLAVKLNPTTTLPSISVGYSWANASPYTLERNVTSILEAGFSTLKGVESLSSKSTKGYGYITLSFSKYTNIDVARFETATIIRQLYKQLPEQTTYPSISVNRPNADESRAFLSYSIKASKTPFEIQKTVSSQIEPVINTINNIDKTEVYGANSKEYVITFNSGILTTLKLSKEDLVNTLKKLFIKENLGFVNYKNNNISLSIQPTSKIDWHIPVKKIEDRLLYLDELTTIKELEKKAQNHYRINGQNAITLNIFATKQANTITLAEKIERSLKDLKKSLPQGYEIIKIYDTTKYLKEELNKIYERTLYTIIILLLFILLINKSLKYLYITLICLVANISISFLLYYVFKVEIQLYSLAGITISLGLIIDNSIVMIDHIRYQHNRLILIPILASTLTTIGALAVIYFLDDKYKVNLIDFAFVIIINLSVSLLIALLLIPALLEKIKLPIKKEKKRSKILKERIYKLYKTIIFIELRFKKAVIIFILLIFGLPIFMLPQKLDDNNTWYGKTYNITLGNEWYRTNIRPHLDKYLGGSFRLFNYFVFENAYYNKNEETKLYVTAAMEKGATVDQMNTVFLELENYLSQNDKINQFTSYVDSGSYARLEIIFDSQISKSSYPHILKSRLVSKVLDYGGIDWSVYGVGDGFKSGSNNSIIPIDFSIKAKGYNYDALNLWADSLKIALEIHPRIQKVLIGENGYRSRKQSYEYRFTIDKKQLALARVTPSKVINELQQLTLSKYEDMSLNIQGKYTPIRLESEKSKTFDIWHIKNTPLDSLDNPLVLKDIAKVTKELEEQNIDKENQEYVRFIEFEYTGSEKFGSNFLDKQLKILETKLPLGYTFERVENDWFFNQNNNNYAYSLLLVMSIIYFICAILFESFSQPFIILSIIPISFIGVFLAFYLFDFNFDQGGLASFVLLSGITVNASIFIIDAFNKLKKEFPNQNKIDLYLEAFKQKIFPIMLTIFSTILGFIPFVKDGQNEVFWFALGVGTIGGLVFSLIGILFYLPIFTLKKSIDSRFLYE